MTYHINPETFMYSVCKAKIKCRFSDSNYPHFESKETAEAFQNALLEKEFLKFSKKKARASFLNTDGLIDALMTESGLEGKALENLKESIDFADKLHQGQKRKALIFGRANTDYIEHPLRCSLRLLRLGVHDQNVLKAAVLHDTIEDGGENFLKFYSPEHNNETEKETRAKVASHIETNFGEKVKDIVLSVTNDVHDRSYYNDFSKEERNQKYRDKVVREINSSKETFMVKVSDFIDNAGGLHYSIDIDPKMSINLAKKYYPLIEEYRTAMIKHEDSLTDEFFDKVSLKLNKIDRILHKLVKMTP